MSTRPMDMVDAEIKQVRRRLAELEQKSEEASIARLRAPKTRARITTANARWKAYAEARDKAKIKLQGLEAERAALGGRT